MGLCTGHKIWVGRVTPCAPPVANQRVRRAEDCPPYQFCPIVFQLHSPMKKQKVLDSVWKWADSGANHGCHRDNSGLCRGAGCAGPAALAPATARIPGASPSFRAGWRGLVFGRQRFQRTITIPVQADIMAVDLTVAGITVAVLMVVVAADMAGIEPRNTRTTLSDLFQSKD